ncbi:unnamed protein product [Lymnaea stagnalis]|uniref:Uncharacterized protein n=1 Tax=Lymnaea stagnalis TaxID=6523 RepID=A0AAV2IU65_LYMST
MSLSSLNSHGLTGANAPRKRHLKKPRPLRSTHAPDESLETKNSSIMLERRVGASDLMEQEMTLDFDHNQNFAHFGYIMTTLRTGAGEDLILTGQSLKTILEAYRILCKGLDATLVKIESVPKNDASTDPISTSPPYPNSMFTDHEESIEEMLKEDIPVTGICYSKQELLQYSLLKLSKRSPPNWNVLTHVHPLCCLPANQVTTYFDPSQFRLHDGNFAVMYMQTQRHD